MQALSVLVVSAALLCQCASAWQPAPQLRAPARATTLCAAPDGGVADDVRSALVEARAGALANVREGSLGSRGEPYVAAQFALLGCIAGGGVPLVGDPLSLAAGPGLVALGGGLVLSGVLELRGVLSPWIVPSENNELRRGGAFALVRHPLYAGLVAGSAGLSVVSDSASRLLLTAALFAVLERKADVEEGALRARYPAEYDAYCDAVPTKIAPSISDFLARLGTGGKNTE
jgi:protein-S-isoprenylcysteine O-methyltransferase Ste14